MERTDAQFIGNAKIVTKQGVITFGGNSIELFLKYLYSLLLARCLGAKLLGVYFLGFNIITFILLIARLEVQQGVLKFVSSLRTSAADGKIKGIMFSAVRIIIINSILVCAVVAIVAHPVSNIIFKQPLLTRVIIIFLLSIPFMGALSVFLSFFQANLKMKQYVLVQNILQPLLNILIFSLVFVLGARLSGAVSSYVASSILAVLAAAYFLNKKFKIFSRNTRPVYAGAQLLRFSSPLVLAAILHFAIQWLDTFILGYFKDMSELGIYSVILKTASLCTIFLVPLNFVFGPIISDLYDKKMISSLEGLFKLITKWTAVLSIPLLLLVGLFAGDILRVFGPEFIAGKNALIVLCAGQAIHISAGSVYYIILMSGKTRLVLVNSILICLVTLALNLILIPAGGFLGAAIANAASLVVFNILMLLEVYGLLKIHPFSFKFLKPMAAAVITIGFFYLFRKSVGGFGWPASSAILAASSLICYAASIWILGFDEEDRAIFGVLKNKLF